MKCKVEKICGGCSLLKLKPSMQADKKKKDVEELVEKAHLKVRVGDVHMAKNDTHYRNKVIIGFAKDKGKVYSGLYAPHSHRVVKTENCIMQPKLVNEIINKITELVGSMKLELYNERTGTGLLRHVLIRWGHKTDEVMVVFVTSQKIFPSRKNMVRVLTSEFPQIKTIVQNINPRKTSIVLQDEAIVLYGDGMIHDELCGLDIAFSHNSFYQIHSEQCKVLYGLAKKMLDLKETDTVLDTYCGVGTIGLTMTDSCKKVMGVEVNPDAIENAKYNAKQNKIKNIEFVAMDSTEFMRQARKYHNHYDAIILDPPRAGTTKDFIECATALNPRKILYISCDPRTQVRDLNQFRKQGYVTNKLELVDLFPYTDHIETVVLLSHKKADSYIHIDVEFGEGEGKIPVDSIAKRAEAYKPKEKVTYKMIKEYIEAKYGFKVHTAYIAEVKRDLGLPMYDAPNAVEELKQPRKHPTPEKVEAIKDALRYFAVI